MLPWAHPKWHLDRFSRFYIQVPTLYIQWAAPSPVKIAPSHGGSGPHLIHGSLGPSYSPQRKRHLDRFSISRFARLTIVTDRPRYIGNIAASTYVVLRCGLIMITRHRASTSMYSLTFCVRVMSPERHHWKPAVQAVAVMLRTPPVTCWSLISNARAPRIN